LPPIELLSNDSLTVKIKMLVMNNDDESFLSAYMDGQLDPDQQQRVESALVANPQLAERLRGFTLLRDLVANLPRDGSVDVTASVMQRIEARGRLRGLGRAIEDWRYGSRRILPLAGLAATAATLMVAASLAILIQTSQFERGGQPVAPLTRGAILVQPSRPSRLPAEPDRKPGVSSEISASSDTAISGATTKGIVAASTVSSQPAEKVVQATEIAANRDLEHVRKFLDSPKLKRFFRVQSASQNDSEQVVANIVEHATHLDFFKLTISQGIVIDPRHPEPAKVFAFVLNPSQLERFHDQLSLALPGLVAQEPVDAAIATQLVDLGTVGSFPPAPLARVEIPREDLALRTKTGGGGEHLHADHETNAPPPREAGPGSPAERGETDNSIVVLVWVSAPPGQ